MKSSTEREREREKKETTAFPFFKWCFCDHEIKVLLSARDVDTDCGAVQGQVDS